MNVTYVDVRFTQKVPVRRRSAACYGTVLRTSRDRAEKITSCNQACVVTLGEAGWCRRGVARAVRRGSLRGLYRGAGYRARWVLPLGVTGYRHGIPAKPPHLVAMRFDCTPDLENRGGRVPRPAGSPYTGLLTHGHVAPSLRSPGLAISARSGRPFPAGGCPTHVPNSWEKHSRGCQDQTEAPG